MSDVDPAEVSPRARTLRTEEYSPEPDDPPPSSKKAEKVEREGLPPGYRMRADAHYVETVSYTHLTLPTTSRV